MHVPQLGKDNLPNQDTRTQHVFFVACGMLHTRIKNESPLKSIRTISWSVKLVAYSYAVLFRLVIPIPVRSFVRFVLEALGDS